MKIWSEDFLGNFSRDEIFLLYSDLTKSLLIFKFLEFSSLIFWSSSIFCWQFFLIHPCFQQEIETQFIVGFWQQLFSYWFLEFCRQLLIKNSLKMQNFPQTNFTFLNKSVAEIDENLGVNKLVVKLDYSIKYELKA